MVECDKSDAHVQRKGLLSMLAAKNGNGSGFEGQGIYMQVIAWPLFFIPNFDQHLCKVIGAAGDPGCCM